MYAQALLSIFLLIIVFTIFYKFGLKPILKEAGIADDKTKSKTAEELDEEIKQLQKTREELLLKEQSIEVLSQQREVEKELMKVNKAREKLKS